MHEEMHMTQMQFMNTGAREIVSVFKKVAWTLRWFAKEGTKTGPVSDAYAKGTTRECTV